MVGAATEKPLEPKQVRTRGTHSKYNSVIVPTSGMACDDSGTLSAIINWKTVIDNNSVIPTHDHDNMITRSPCASQHSYTRSRIYKSL